MTLPIVKTPRSPEVKFRRELQLLVKSLENDIKTEIIPILEAYEQEYVSDAYASLLEQAFERLRNRYQNVGRLAKTISSEFVGEVDQNNKRRFYTAMNNAIGVDVSSIVANENLSDFLIAKTRENVSLIKSISDEYFKKIETMVFEGTTTGKRSKSLIQEIREVGKVTEKRARVIARDQTSKINSALNQKRQQNLGVEEYIWRTASDDRVRESHKSKNGKTFKWSEPPKDTGHPGEDIQCRCIAQPIIKI